MRRSSSLRGDHESQVTSSTVIASGRMWNSVYQCACVEVAVVSCCGHVHHTCRV